ncbi:MAG: preprotein translocase subunit SecA [Candidatus Euphemobacter frigidus]|nr:preprotein translocase subunit SecA [Candidatus Euphemobacter frigidus]MDP8275809.1 preprotein translocase subunit SecA [Candidatus Euphemobacter frigidus]
MSVLKKIFGTKFDRDRKRLQPLVDEINRLESEYQHLSDEEIRDKTVEFRRRFNERTGELRKLLQDVQHSLTEEISPEEEGSLRGEERRLIGRLRAEEKAALDELLPEAFAVVKNVCRRLLGRTWSICGQEITWEMVPFDVQLIGAIVLHQGKIAEMATGEGKTLVATMPLYLNTLSGKNVHLVTVNDYLALRDREWMGPVYESLGITVGCIQGGMSPAERREVYACDITYGTNNEFGFDYLRDNMARREEDQVQRKYLYYNKEKDEIQRGHYYAIIDEVDSILIDEARTPLIISGPVTVSTHKFKEVMPRMKELARKQSLLCSRLLKEGKELLEKGGEEEAYRKFYQVKKGAPLNKQLLSLMEQPEIRKLLQKSETDLDSKSKQAPRTEEGRALREELFFTINERAHEIDITEKGHVVLSPDDPEEFVLPDFLTARQEIDEDSTLLEEEKKRRVHYLEEEVNLKSEKIHNAITSLRALALFEKDVNYVIQNNQVIIVDEFTGRLMPGRRYSDGLHQALEAKEGVMIERETQTLASITIQNYFRMYEKLAGMTGTAETEAVEFDKIYKLDVIVIPTNRPIARTNHNDRIYKTKNEKYRAVIEEIQECHRRGQPVLVGTITVETSEILSRLLKRRKIPHQVLNARYHQQEAEIVSRAGQPGTVTISTNMAGRGTDIKLGDGVVKKGGLHIVGTERHEARRIDLQLRGRSARQGDPGSSRFYLSLEDELMRLFGSDRIAGIMSKMGLEEGEEMTHPLLTRAIVTAQKRVEAHNFSIREQVLKYDDIINKQREEIYAFRNSIIDSNHPRRGIMAIIEEVVDDKTALYCPEDAPSDEWNWKGLESWISSTFPIHINVDKWREEETLSREQLVGRIMEMVNRLYDFKEEYEGTENMRQLEKLVILGVIDRLWQEHLYTMDDLRQGISLRAYAQVDPLIAYKEESFKMFSEMENSLKQEVAANIFRSTIRPMVESISEHFIHEQVRAFGRNLPAPAPPPLPPDRMGVSPGMGPGVPPPETASVPAPTYRRAGKKIGPNDPCPCGSGKKYKKCCGR